MKTQRHFSRYSVDIITADGCHQDAYQYDTQSKARALKKFDVYVKKEAFDGETVQLWSRLGNDNNINLVKEKFVKKARDPRYSEETTNKTDNQEIEKQ